MKRLKSSWRGVEVRLLLDTAAFIFAMDSPERLSRRAASALRNPGNILELSTISLAEIAIKAALGKLQISSGTVREAVQELDMRVLPYSADHAFQLFDLPRHHGDPFDRQIIGQALAEGIPVVTPDEMFRLYKGLRVIW
jgi:PIN domain nuclease of toxin-antitoxin system